MGEYLSLPIPTANGAIRPKHIYDVLDVKRRVNGYDLNYIASNLHGKTNLWAKYKPVKHSSIEPLTERQRKNVAYGIHSEPDYLQDGVVDNMEGVKQLIDVKWVYDAPSMNDVARIDDWKGYEHTAVSPMTPPGDIYVESNVTNFEIRLANNKIHTELGLSAADFPWADDKYLCVVVWRVKTSTGVAEMMNYKTAPVPMGEIGGDVVTFEAAELKNLTSGYNTPEYLLCLSSNCYTGNWKKTASEKTSFYPLVCDEPTTGTITIRDESVFFVSFDGISNKGDYSPKPILDYSYADQIGGALCFGAAEGVGLWIHGKAINRTSVTQTQRLSNIGFKLMSQTLASEGTSTGLSKNIIAYGKSMYYRRSGSSTWTLAGNVTGVSVAPGETVDIIIDISALPYLLNDRATGYAVREWVWLNFNLLQVTQSTSNAPSMGFISLHVWDGVGDKVFKADQLAVL